MAGNEMSLRQFLEDYLPQRDWKDKSCNAACKDGWYDWFCPDQQLAGRLHRMTKKIQQVARSSKVNQDTMYVFFKNNCPGVGSLYDDFRFCDRETGKVIYTIIPSSGFKVNKGVSEVWGHENNFQVPLVSGTWEDVSQFFAN